MEDNLETPKPFTENPSQPSDSAECSLYSEPKQDTNRPGDGVREPQSLLAREPRQAEDDGPTVVNVVATTMAKSSPNIGESGNRPCQEPHQMENVSGSGDDPQSTMVSDTAGLTTQTGTRESEPPFQGIGVWCFSCNLFS